MLSFNRGAIYSTNGHRVVFDPERKIKHGLAIISHAHSDHARKHSVTSIMTPETQAISGLDAVTVPYGKHSVEGIELEFTDAGHVLGSAQARIDDVVYTGDFRMADSPLFKGAQPMECDDLIIETTFGRPEYVFPDPAEVGAELGEWVKKNSDAGRIVVVGGYALGKSQELTRALNDSGIVPVVHHKIHAINDIYSEHGKNLGEYVHSDSEEGREMMRDAFVVQMPQHAVREDFLHTLSVQNHRPVVACTATGWAGTFFTRGVQRTFPLSDHADYSQLMEYVEQAQPKRVHTMHGFAAEFARQLQRKGWDAMPIKGREKTLHHFL